ncbi:MAG: nucleotidyltransferase domain-containing protein [Aquificaceae bacterium]|jgi:predicted nucleotidyltransferase
MPVRSLSSSVIRWVSKEEVEKALREWAHKVRSEHPEVLRVGYFGSYARGNWGVGSDVDLLLVVSESKEPFIRRPLAFDTTELPVPADLLVYTEGELDKLKDTRFYREVLQKEVVWLF